MAKRGEQRSRPRPTTVLISDLDSGDEYLIDERGQVVVELSFVVPDQAAAVAAGIPETELIRGRGDSESSSAG
jgi:hypothetical protein